MKKGLVAIALVVVSTVCGALPPLAQSSRELQAILSDSHLFELLGSAGLLHSIMKTKDGYLIVTRTHALRVDIEYLRAPHPGPVPFEVHFHQPLRIDANLEEPTDS